MHNVASIAGVEFAHTRPDRPAHHDPIGGKFNSRIINAGRFNTTAGATSRRRAQPEHLVRLTWYVTETEEYLAKLKTLGQVYRDIFGAHYPAMALVQVVRLVENAARVEIEATAVAPR